ncbi:glycerate kinase family protein [Collimonas arenae]|uniref:Glycerate kinase family protein n=1 Tax=Collimonas arenae TaxID=279058 RepID=A0A127QDS6_9BURK|nr:glycerate kinase [Collimonas arenae]AMP08219.1 glycerate kinase family protein [Collimonas arenae]
MKIVIAPDSFKESLSAAEAADAIRAGFSEIFPNAEFVLLPIADGGEGTVQTLLRALGGEYKNARVSDPLGRPIDAKFGITPEGVALIETAAASGLERLAPSERNPLIASSRGTGELILAALDAGLRRFVIGLGGSATNDAAIGILQVLGVRMLDSDSQDVTLKDIQRLEKIDVTGLDRRLRECQFELACDVDNPLCGPSGASVIFGPQKGATPEMVAMLDQGLAHFAAILQRDFNLHEDLIELPGGGAAGGIGATLAAILGARLRPGTEIIAEATKLAELIDGAALVITGEGRVDSQTVRGKAPAGVARIARMKDIPVIALGGSLGADADALYHAGVNAVFSAVHAPCSLDEALRDAYRNVRSSARNIAAAIRIGQSFY